MEYLSRAPCIFRSMNLGLQSKAGVDGDHRSHPLGFIATDRATLNATLEV